MNGLRQAALGAWLVTGIVGCESVTLPSAEGRSEMQVSVRGDDSDGMRAYRASDEGRASGRVDVEARVYLRARSGEWIEVTDGPARQSVDASGSDGSRPLATDSVAATTYTRVRVEFERLDASLNGGIQLGAGVVTANVQVDGGSDGKTTVERDLRIDARAGSSSRLEIDLNSDAWLGRADSGTSLVAESAFESAVRISAR